MLKTSQFTLQYLPEQSVMVLFLLVSIGVHAVVLATDDWFEFKLTVSELVNENKVFKVNLKRKVVNKSALQDKLQIKPPVEFSSTQETVQTPRIAEIMQQIIDYASKNGSAYNERQQQQQWGEDVTTDSGEQTAPINSYRDNTGNIHTQFNTSWGRVCFVNRMQDDTQEFDFPLLNYEQCPETKKILDLSGFDRHD